MPAAARTGAALATLIVRRLPAYKRQVLTCYLMVFLSVQNRLRALPARRAGKGSDFSSAVQQGHSQVQKYSLCQSMGSNGQAGSPRLHFLKRIVCEAVGMRLLRSFTIIMLPIDARRPNRRSPCNAYSQALARVQKTSIDLLSHGFSFGAESEPHPVRWAKTEKSGFFQVTSLQY